VTSLSDLSVRVVGRDSGTVPMFVSGQRENLGHRDRLVRPVYVCVFKCDIYKNLKLQIDNYFLHVFGQSSKRNFSVYD